MTIMHNDCGCADETDCGCADPVKITGHVTGTMRTNPEASDYASYTSFTFTGTASDVPIQILGRDNDRARALIVVAGAVGSGAYIGKMEQLTIGASTTTGLPANGWLQLPTTPMLELKNKQAVWALGVFGFPCVVYVLNERWNSGRTD